jgi:hypothetical protein
VVQETFHNSSHFAARPSGNAERVSQCRQCNEGDRSASGPWIAFVWDVHNYNHKGGTTAIPHLHTTTATAAVPGNNAVKDQVALAIARNCSHYYTSYHVKHFLDRGT